MKLILMLFCVLLGSLALALIIEHFDYWMNRWLGPKG